MIYETYVTPETLGMIWVFYPVEPPLGPVELPDILLVA